MRFDTLIFTCLVVSTWAKDADSPDPREKDTSRHDHGSLDGAEKGFDNAELVERDLQAPIHNSPIMRCKMREKRAEPPPKCTRYANIDNGSFSPLGLDLVLSQVPPGPYPIGTTSVTLTATDTNGRSSSCIRSVTIVQPSHGNCIQSQPPVMVCGNRHRTADASTCTAWASIDDGSYSRSGGSLLISQEPPPPYDVGKTLVTLTATDRSGQKGTCTREVNVEEPWKGACIRSPFVNLACDNGVNQEMDNPTCSSECKLQPRRPARGQVYKHHFSVEEDSIVDVIAHVSSAYPNRRFRLKMDGRYISGFLGSPSRRNVFRERKSRDGGVYVRGGQTHALEVEFLDRDINLCSVQVKLDRTIVPSRDTRWTYIEAGSYRSYHKERSSSYQKERSSSISYDCDRAGLNLLDVVGQNCKVTDTESGDWLSYGLLVKQKQKYSIYADIYSMNQQGALRLEVDGRDVSRSARVPYTGHSEISLVQDLLLVPGRHEITVFFETDGVDLKLLKVSGDRRRPFDLAAYIPRRIRTCFVGDKCRSSNCAGLFSEDGDMAVYFDPETFMSVKASEVDDYYYYDKRTCLTLVLDNSEYQSIVRELERFVEKISRQSNEELNLKLHVIQFNDLDVGLTGRDSDSEAGPSAFWIDSWDMEDVVEERLSYLNLVPDFNIVIQPTHDPVKRMYHETYWASSANYPPDIAGGGWGWVPYTYDDGLADTFDFSLFWQVRGAYEELTHVSNIYSDDEMPPCGEHDWDPYKWFPDPSTSGCEVDPDSPTCGSSCYSDEETTYYRHILHSHFNPGEAFVANSCKNGVQDYEENGVDVGGQCPGGGGKRSSVLPRPGENQTETGMERPTTHFNKRKLP